MENYRAKQTRTTTRALPSMRMD